MKNSDERVPQVLVDITSLNQGEPKFFSGTLHIPDVLLPEMFSSCAEPVRYSFQVILVEDEVVVSGQSSGKVEGVCHRCLEPVLLELEGEIQAVYKPASSMGEVSEENVEDYENVLYYTEHQLDMADRVIESLMVEIPFKVLCAEDCQGLCPYCGENLNEHPEHVCTNIPGEEEKPHPFSQLRMLAEQQREGNSNESE
ncbi:MAG TPA: DUF177 domain-containing protein [Thermotogota bacterium]|nr:DUF177 domain-containing protein [Thermotogota bacterium]HRW91904.1 DUF177 domain-containing protein [Thermotogota bacterium]